MTTRIKLRRDTTANWQTNNPILALGEPGLDTTNNSVKYGDGITHWNNLPYSGEGTTENVWIATLSGCANSLVKVSRDGVKWTEAFKPMPRLYFGGWQNFWYAKPLGGKVIYDMYVDYLSDETLGWSDNALDYPNPATFTNSPIDDDIDSRDWWDVYYINGKFIAVGGFFMVGTENVERPMFATSDDGKTWTYGVIDQTYISNLVSDADADPTGVRITSVAYNGVGYLFALEWDHQFGGSSIGGLAPGFFYVTGLNTTLNASNHINPSIDNNAGLKGLVWNNDHWAAYGHQNVWDRASLFVNTNLNPNTGTWTEISLNSTASNGPQKSVFGCYPDFGNTLAAFTTGKIGDYYWDVMALNNGRVMATKDKGVTWIGSVPFNLYNDIDTVIWDGTNTKITFNVPNFDGGYYSPSEGERIDIRYGNVEQLDGIFYLGAETDSDGEWREWTIYSDKALTQAVNSSAWAESYDHAGPQGYAVITFSRDGDGNDPLTFGGFDQVKIADGKIVAINGGAWACSTDLIEWTLSFNTDVFTSYAYGTSDLEWGTAGSTNRSSLTYVSDSNYALEAAKDAFLGPNPGKSTTWGWAANGNYVNQLALAENFKVTIGGTGLTSGFTAPISMGMEPTGKWWIGHDNWQQDEFGTFTPTSIAAEDWDGPGFADIVIRTDTGEGNNEWVFLRNGATYFPNYNFPSAHGTSGQVLVDDGNGNLSWGSAGSGWDLTNNIANTLTASKHINIDTSDGEGNGYQSYLHNGTTGIKIETDGVKLFGANFARAIVDGTGLTIPSGDSLTLANITAKAGSVSGTNKETTDISWDSGTSTYIVTYATSPGYGFSTKVKFGGTNISEIEGSGQTFYLNPINYPTNTQWGVYSDAGCTTKVNGSAFSTYDPAPPAYTTELITGDKISIKTANPSNGVDPGAIEFKIGGKTYGWTIDKDNHLRLPADGNNAKIKNYYGHNALFANEAISVTSVFNGTSALTLKANAGIPTSVTKTSANQGWGSGSVGSNLPTTGGSGTGLTVDVADGGSAYANIGINTPGSGYIDGETLTVTNGGMSDTFTVSVGEPKTWTFGTDGALTLPAGGEIKDSTGTSILDRISVAGSSVVLTKDIYNTSRLTFTGGATIETAGYITDVGGLALVDSSAQNYVTTNNERVQITTGFPNGGTGIDSYNDWWFLKSGAIKLPKDGILENNGKQWAFGVDGRTTFPAATVPAHSYGSAGDKAGMVAFDSTYIYYCTANYVNTSTDIWKRTAHGAGTW